MKSEAATMRPYQQECVDAIRKEFASGVTSTLVELPTGCGKTEVFVELMRTWESGRCIVILPIGELVKQTRKKILARTGLAPDIERADMWSNESNWGRAEFVVGMKQTLTKPRKDGSFRYHRMKDIGLVVVDEAHLSVTKPYKEMLDWFKANGGKVLGMTATAKRHDKRAMGLNFESVAYQYGITDAIPDGWLVSAVTDCVQLKTLNLSKVKTTAGDFDGKQLDTELEHDETVLEVADVTARESAGLKTVVYCSSVQQARLVAERLVDNYGVKADWVCGDKKLCDDIRRKNVLESFTEDQDGVHVVCNVGVLTTGWDFPGLEHIVMARPTKSLALYTQIFGRGTRPLPGVVDFDGSTAESRREAIANSRKPHFKVTDLVDNSMAHKIVTCADVLGGSMSMEVIERAKKDLLGEQKPVRIEDALEAARKAIQDEKEEEERQRRARVQAQAEYAKIRVDPFDEYSRGSGTTGKPKSGARMPFGKFSGKLLAEIPLWYLKGTQQDKPKISAPWLKQAIARELESRGVKGVPAAPQAKPAPATPMFEKLDDINSLLLTGEW